MWRRWMTMLLPARQPTELRVFAPYFKNDRANSRFFYWISTRILKISFLRLFHKRSHIPGGSHSKNHSRWIVVEPTRILK